MASPPIVETFDEREGGIARFGLCLEPGRDLRARDCRRSAERALRSDRRREFVAMDEADSQGSAKD